MKPPPEMSPTSPRTGQDAAQRVKTDQCSPEINAAWRPLTTPPPRGTGLAVRLPSRLRVSALPRSSPQLLTVQG